MKVDIAQLKKENQSRWLNMKADVSLAPIINKVAARLVAAAAKSQYVSVSGKTNVPWGIIAVIHEREASQSWKANLAQGDPWNKISIHVPKGRGPFASWEEAALDALVNCAPRAAAWKDWSVGGALTLLEEYNGLGYAAMGKPSPTFGREPISTRKESTSRMGTTIPTRSIISSGVLHFLRR
jgi:lysozyme family protein